MNELLLNSKTKNQLDAYASRPSPHGVIITGVNGSGKTEIVMWLAAKLLNIKTGKLATYPYFMTIEPETNKTLKIDVIRSVDHFLARKVPGPATGINRVLFIKNADQMSLPAQNALLKNLEEPPLDTVIILSASDYSRLLPTIRSRSVRINVLKPLRSELKAYLTAKGYDAQLIERAISISGGLTKLTLNLLDDESSSVNLAANTARELLTQDRYHRLIRLNALAKDKESLASILAILKRMSAIALEKASGTQFDQWTHILEVTNQTETYLKHNGNTKLALLNLLNRL